MIRVLVSALTGCVIAASLAFAQWGQPMMISGGSAGQTIASVSLSNSTFTNSSANATVGTISVTMSPSSPAFTGSLSITGTNSGGFHLVGTTLETNAGGTTSGTYSDLTIVATQTGAGSRSISPTLVGSAGGGVACDIGLNAPVPAPATAAGFTTCVINADFTTNTADAHGVNFGDPNTWAPACGASPTWNNTLLRLSFQDFNAPSTATAPCNRMAITADEVYGGQVLKFAFNPATDYPAYNFLELEWPGSSFGSFGPCVGGNCAGGPNGHGLWKTFYAEMNYRLSPASYQQSPAPTNIFVLDFWANGCTFCTKPDALDYGAEIDFSEVGWDIPLNHFGSIKAGSFPTYVWNMDDTVYRTLGILITSDGTNTAECAYVDSGITTATPVAGCISAPLGSFYNNIINIWVGQQGQYATHPFVNPVTIYLKSLRVFDCANYWNAECTGTLITH